MTRYSPKEFAQVVGSGLLSFPITHFKSSDLSFDVDAYRANLNWLFSHDAAAMFAAGGTGEFFSLTQAEVLKLWDAVSKSVRMRPGAL